MNDTNQPIFRFTFSLFQQDDPLQVFEIGTHKTPPCHSFGPAVRPYYLLHLVEKGTGYIERNGIKYYVPEGSAFLIRPDEVTLYCSDEDEPWEYWWIAFHGSFAHTLMQRTTDRLFAEYKKSGLLALKNAVKCENQDSLSCLSTLLEVLNSIKKTPQPMETDGIAEAMRYFENNYFHQIDVESLAAQFGFSRAYFSTLFMKQTGETPYAYLTKIRLEKAKSFLQDNRHSMEEIAYSVGFNSLQRFSEMFKKHVGISPLQYRKTKKN